MLTHQQVPLTTSSDNIVVPLNIEREFMSVPRDVGKEIASADKS